jgi:acetoin utilization deacetylase AcuC-like enzyme
VLPIAFAPRYAHPLPAGHRFPMLKYELIPAQLLHQGIVDKESFFEPTSALPVDILRVHTEAYYDKLTSLSLTTQEIRRMGFPLSKELIEREVCIAGGTVEAARRALPHGAAFNVAGGTHHAFSDLGEGFCLLNDQAIAAAYLLAEGLAERVLIIDLDVHQGNGTAKIFAEEPRVFTLSMHGASNFPARKEHSDLDLPLPDGTTDAPYLALLAEHLPRVLDSFRPDFAFYLTPEGCRARDSFVYCALRARGLPVVTCMGGGYSPRVADIVDAHCRTFQEALSVYES